MASSPPIAKYVKDTWVFPVTLTVAGQAFDQTGYTVAADFHKDSTSDPLVLTVGQGITYPDQSTGSFDIRVTPAQYGLDVGTKAITATSFPTHLRVYDTAPNGDIETRVIIPIAPQAT